ncbi:MAG: copper chaperone PCu(A)C [Spirochaetaceae bacterium]|nr:MAG: copper chaperone PCu(A)C [Spirochaetaceae bacterium]
MRRLTTRTVLLLAMIAAVAVFPLTLAAGGRREAAHHAHDHGNDISINNAWIRASVDGDENGAAYMVIRNRGKESIRLIAARSDLALAVELHTHTRVDGLMRMIEVPHVEVAAGEEVVFEPGGYHIMFLGLTSGFTEGDRHTIDLIFEGRDPVAVSFVVQPLATRGGMQHNH